MATERAVMTPDGDVIYFEVADEQYMTPEGSVLDGGLDAPAGGAITIEVPSGGTPY